MERNQAKEGSLGACVEGTEEQTHRAGGLVTERVAKHLTPGAEPTQATQVPDRPAEVAKCKAHPIPYLRALTKRLPRSQQEPKQKRGKNGGMKEKETVSGCLMATQLKKKTKTHESNA